MHDAHVDFGEEPNVLQFRVFRHVVGFHHSENVRYDVIGGIAQVPKVTDDLVSL